MLKLECLECTPWIKWQKRFTFLMDIFGHFEFCYNRRNSFRTERASCIQMQYNTQETLPLFDGAFPVPPFAFPLYTIATLYYQASMVPLCCAELKLNYDLI